MSTEPKDNPDYQMPAELAATPHPLVEAEQRQAQLVAHVMGGVSRMLHEHMAGIKLELRAVTNDNSVLRENLALLNTGMAEFQRTQVIPLREALLAWRETDSRTVENAANLEVLIKALADTLAIKGGLIPTDLLQKIKDGRFEELEHVKEGEQVHVSEVQAMIDAAYQRGLEAGRAK